MFTADFATLAANPTLFSKLNYNAEKDFQPVGLLARFPMFLAVANSVPASNLKEFSAWAKQQGKPIIIGKGVARKATVAEARTTLDVDAEGTTDASGASAIATITSLLPLPPPKTSARGQYPGGGG